MKHALRSAIILGFLFAAGGVAGQEAVWHHGASFIGDVKYPAGFKHFDYVNPDAPKGGTLQLSETGTFDTFNATLDKGVLFHVQDLLVTPPLICERLMKKSEDEPSSVYGLLAKDFSYPNDYSSATFRLNPEARWADGEPVTAADVVFSFDKLVELNPQFANYYKHVVSATEVDERTVTFKFDETGNRELPLIVGELHVVPKHWWEGKDAQGNQRDISKTSLEPPMCSGPYEISSFSAGSKITLKLRDDYWGKNLNVNVGQYNFKNIVYTYFGDINSEFQAFRAGDVDFWRENEAKRWATGYDFPAFNEGKVKREELPNEYRDSGIMLGFIPNQRRDLFKDKRVREALNYAFDFETLNRTVFFNQYKRINSYFYGSELASKGLPEGDELALLESLKPDVPEEVFTQAYKNPVFGSVDKERENLRKAFMLLKEAGYERRDGKLVNSKTGQPFTFEILLNGPTIEKVALPFAAELRKLGIVATIRTVDPSQYVSRVTNFDYDMIYLGWAQSISPGNEQLDYFGSKSANQPGSRNYAGISNSAVDALINKIIFSKHRDALETAVHALDRVLLAGDYIVPGYTARTSRIAYWDKFERPSELPYYSLGFPTDWWAKSAER